MPRSLTPLLVALLVVYSVHQGLSSVSAPVVRVLSLTPTQLGLVFTIASVVITLAGPLWGLLIDSAGLRPVLAVGLGLCVAGTAGFAAAVTFGLDETLTSDVAFAFVLVFRSALFSAGLAAVLVATLAVAGLSTHGEIARARAVGFVGATQGLGAVAGPIVGGALAVASLSLPLYVAPVATLLLAVLVFATLAPPAGEPAPPVRVRPLELLPAFGAGFFLHLSIAMAQVVIVHLAADRLGSGSIEGLLLASGLGLLLAQGLFVPLLKWSPSRLLRTGAPVAAAGYALLALAPSAALVTLALLVASVGVGLAVTGFAAAASLGAGPERQGLMAGLVTATSGLTFLGGPLLSALLFEVQPLLPVLAAALAAGIAAALAFLSPAAAPQFEGGPGPN
ncbi:MFS transporter [Lentzea sp. NPDC055074]